MNIPFPRHLSNSFIHVMMMTSSSSARVFLLVTTLVLLRASSDPLQQDTEALLSFIKQVKKKPGSRYNWDRSQDTCAWVGVGCSTDNYTVVNLRIPGASLVGKIPASSIGNLTSLRILSLRDNGLSGPIPDDFANLAQLSYVYLHNNKFSGPFPSSLTNWTQLVSLDLSNNQFSGMMPVNEASISSKLEKFRVSNNNLSGPIPSSLANKFQAPAFSGNFDLCGKPLSNICNRTIYPSSSSPSPSGSLSPDDKKKKKKKLSTGHIVAIAIGSAFVLLILCLRLGKKLSRAVKKNKAPGVATMAAAAAAAAKKGEAGTSVSKDDVTGASMEGERNK